MAGKRAKKTYPFDPDWTMRPGVHIAECLEAAGLNDSMGVRHLARQLNVTDETAHGLLSGAIEIDEDFAMRLSRAVAIGGSAGLWLNLERNYRAALKAGKKDISDD